MKKCPYCGHENENQRNNCERCYAGLPAEKQEEQPKRVAKKPNKESE